MRPENVDNWWSDIYDQGRDFTLAASHEISKFLGFAHPALPKTALDIGCGTGQLTRELYHRGYKTVGIDASTSAIQIACSLTVVPPEQLSYVRFDIERNEPGKLPHAPYGLITCKLVYAFIEDKPTFLKRVKQLLAPEGLFVVVTPLPEHVPPEKIEIAASADDVALLSSAFDVVAQYEERGLTYFLGTT
jgi:SAM-dependent methyltransferase